MLSIHWTSHSSSYYYCSRFLTTTRLNNSSTRTCLAHTSRNFYHEAFLRNSYLTSLMTPGITLSPTISTWQSAVASQLEKYVSFCTLPFITSVKNTMLQAIPKSAINTLFWRPFLFSLVMAVRQAKVLLNLCSNNSFLCSTVKAIWRSRMHSSRCHDRCQYRHDSDSMANNSKTFTLLLRLFMRCRMFSLSACFKLDTSGLHLDRKGQIELIVSLRYSVCPKENVLSEMCIPVWLSGKALMVTLLADSCVKPFLQGVPCLLYNLLELSYKR